MVPQLFRIGNHPVSSYSVLLVVALVTSCLVASRLARKDGLDPQQIFLLSWLTILAGFIGARLLQVCAQLSYFLENPLEIFLVWDGWAFLGGPVISLLFVIWYARRHRLPTWKVLDVFSVGLAVGDMVGRVGCFLRGCCYGRPTHNWFGVRLYGQEVDASLRGIPLHPTQLYEAGGMLVLFVALLWLF